MVLQLINKNIYKSEFAKNVLTLFSGSTISQIIPFLVAPILARMYAPENFGELGVLMAVAGIFSIVATFQYESAIMLPKKDEDAFNILALAVSISIFISFLSWITIKIFSDSISIILKTDSIEKWTFIIPAFVFLTGLYNSLNIWASRKKQYKRLAVRQIAQSTSGAGTKLSLGWLGYINSGLIWGTIVGQFTSTAVLAIKTIQDSKYLLKSINFKSIKKNAVAYQDFPKYTMWQGFLDLVNASGVVFILSSFYGVALVGLYTFTLAMLQKPTKMIGSAVSQVFYQNASKKVSENKPIYNDTVKLIKNLAIISGIVFLPFLIAGPQIFSFVFGEKWRDAGAIAQIISPWLFLRFIASPLANLAMIMDKQKVFLYISIGINLLMPLIVFIYGWFQKDYQSAFIAVIIPMVISLLIVIKWAVNISRGSINPD